MDRIADGERFRKLLARLCETMGKPFTEELIDSWWLALLHVPFDVVKGKVEAFIATAGRDDKFPRPAMMRPPEMEPGPDGGQAGNYARDFWRSVIVHEVAYQLGVNPNAFAGHVVQLRATMGEAMRLLLDELTTEDMQTGRSPQMHERCKRRCESIAWTNRHIAAKDSPVLRNPVAA